MRDIHVIPIHVILIMVVITYSGSELAIETHKNHKVFGVCGISTASDVVMTGHDCTTAVGPLDITILYILDIL